MPALHISQEVQIPDSEIELKAIRSRGAGGQHVNKVSTGIQLRFDIAASSLPDFYKQRLLTVSDHRVSPSGIVVIKSDGARSQEDNRIAALERLKQLIQSVAQVKKKRRPTQPGKRAKARRMDEKTQRGKNKQLRKPPKPE